MANFDDPYQLLCYIRKAFVDHDETGLCREIIRDKLPKKSEMFPTLLESYESVDEEQSTSSEDFTNADFERNERTRVKFFGPLPSPPGADESSSEEEYGDLEFEKKGINKTRKRGRSLLSCQMELIPPPDKNPFVDYSKYNGDYEYIADTKTFKVFLAISAKARLVSPVRVCIPTSAKISQLLGLTCFRYRAENPYGSVTIDEDLNKYCIYSADEWGEIDWEFDPLDPDAEVDKFRLPFLALVRLADVKASKGKKIKMFTSSEDEEEADEEKEKEEMENLARFMEDLKTLETLTPETYRIKLIYKKKKKVKVVLAISLDKVEVETDPFSGIDDKPSWKLPEISLDYDIRNIVACEILKKKSRDRTIFRITHHSEDDSGCVTYKNDDFESDTADAEKILEKLNCVMEVRGSSLRKEYLENASKEKKKENWFKHALSLWSR